LAIGSLLWISKNDWSSDKDSNSNKYFIHFASNERYIDDYYANLGGSVKGWDKNRYVLSSISDSSLDYIRKTVFSNVISRFHNLDVEIETHVNQTEFDLLNEFPSPRGYLNFLIPNYHHEDSIERQSEVVDSIASLYLSEEAYLNFENKIKDRLDFAPNFIIVVNIYNVYDKKLDKFQGIYYDLHVLKDFDGNFVGPYCPGSFHHVPELFENPDELIEELSVLIPKPISELTFGSLMIGEVSEILDNNMVKILLYDNTSVNRNVTLIHRSEYVYIEDGYEKRIEDIEVGLKYYQNNPDKFDSTKYQQLSSELKGLKDGTDRNRGERAKGRTVYTLDIIDVIDNMVIAKIISKDPPYWKVRIKDIIEIRTD
jgi:hypothetical protein